MPGESLYVLKYVPDEQRYVIRKNSLSLAPEIIDMRQRWEAWLSTTTSFAFEDRQGNHSTIRRERLQRGETYWYAYRSIQGHTRKRYLGKTSSLTLEKLEAVSALFVEQQNGVPGQENSTTRSEGNFMPLLETKLHPPLLAGALIERTRLLKQLDASLTHRLTIVQAPAGSGKTTQVNQWLVARGSQERRSALSAHPDPLNAVAWVSLDGGDNDSLRFWRYLATACQKLLGKVSREEGQTALAHLTSAVHPSFGQPALDLALTHLLNALAGPVSGGILVLDDYHVISEPAIHERLAFFIDHLPASVHLLLLSRAEPALPLLRWRARGEVNDLRSTDLRFSVEETASFLRQILPVLPSATALSQLEKSLEGWAAGLRLLSCTLSGWSDAPAIEQALLALGQQTDLALQGQTAGTGLPHRDLFNYFVSELLEKQPADIQRFLLQTSVLERLCAPLCDAATASIGSATRLEAVARAGLFLEAIAGAGDWYRYHALFAEAMRREAARRLGADALQAISLRASHWYEQENLLAEAIEAAWLARDLERMATLIEQFNEQHFYEPYTILHWLERLPDAVLHAHPRLCLLFATELHFPGQLRFSEQSVDVPPPPSAADDARGEALLRSAEATMRTQGDIAWIGGIYAHRALYTLLYQQSFSVVADLSRQALTFLHQPEATDHRLRTYRAACLLFVGMEKLHLGQLDEAYQMLMQAREDNRFPENRFLALDLNLMSGKSYLMQGELKSARRYLNQALTMAREIQDNEVIADALLELAWIALEMNDSQTAEWLTTEALSLAERLQPPVPALLQKAALHRIILQHRQGTAPVALLQLAELESGLASEWAPASIGLAERLRLCRQRFQPAAHPVSSLLTEPLSAQEERVLRLLATGWSNQEIAHELIISINTVKYHIKHLYQKLGVSNRLQASALARQILSNDQDRATTR